MDKSVRQVVTVIDPAASWAGYWQGRRDEKLPANVTGAYVRGWRTGRIDAGLDALDLDGAMAIAEQAWEHVQRRAA